MKLKYFSLAAFFAAIPIMFFACSDGGSLNGPLGTVSTENFQIYSGSSAWGRNGTIRMEIYNESRGRIDYVDIGTVKNGIGGLDFPGDMSEYLLPLEYLLPVSYLKVSQQGVMVTEQIGLYVISGDEAFLLEAYYETESRSSYTYESVGYVYASKAVDITGNYDEGEFDIRAGKGWNALYTSCTFNSIYEGSCKISTNKNSVSNNIKWHIEYEGPSAYFGGPETGRNPGSSSSGGNPSGAWCVDHYYEECTNEPYYLTTQTCENWNGVLQDYCPAGYEEY